MKSSNSRNEDTLICDTGPLLALARINFLPVLHKLFPSCFLTETVLAECLGKPQLPDARVIQAAVTTKILTVVKTPLVRDALCQLDEGEQSVLETALRRNAVALLDEKRGRILARQLGVRVIGSLGVILLAKHQHYIESAMPYIQSLSVSGYYLSPEFVEQCRLLAGE